MAYHVPFHRRYRKAGSEPPVYIGFDRSPGSQPQPLETAPYWTGRSVVVAPREKFNWWGLWGFLGALFSPFTAFLLAPVALLISLRGLAQPRRGLAFAGTLISLGGTAVLATVIIAAVAESHQHRAAQQRVIEQRVLAEEKHRTETILLSAAAQLREYRDDHDGLLPAGVEGNVITIGFEDAWSNPLRYEPETEQATIRSAGPDGEFDTPDDMVLTVKGTPQGKL